MHELATAAELITMEDYTRLVNAWDGREFTDKTGEILPCLPADMRRLKNSAMTEDEYSLFRATNEVFWKSLATDERMKQYASSETVTVINGDMHLDNLGICMIDGVLYIRVNDFDEGVLADYKFDLVRMATSMRLAFDKAKRPLVKEAVKAMVRAYFSALEIMEKTGLSLTEIRKDYVPDTLQSVFRSVTVGSEEEFIRSITKEKNDTIAFRYAKKGKLQKAPKKERESIVAGLSGYWQQVMSETGQEGELEVLDVARRERSGLGSYGQPRYYALVRHNGELRVLDIKSEPTPPTAYYFLPVTQDQIDAYEAVGGGEAQWRVFVRNALIGSSETYAGWLEAKGRQFLVRERKAVKEPMDLSHIKSEEQFIAVGTMIGELLAGNHAHAHAALYETMHGSKPEAKFANHVLKAIGDDDNWQYINHKDKCAKLIWELAKEQQDTVDRLFHDLT